jgi:DNA-binding response OmpR family regulator
MTPTTAALGRILLVGAQAAALGPRLDLTGYTSQVLDDSQGPAGFKGDGAADPPAAVILSPDGADWIPTLRRLWSSAVLLLGLETDGLHERSRCLCSGADDFWLTTSGPSELLTRLRMHLQMGSRPSLAAMAPSLAPRSLSVASRQAPREADLQLADLRLSPTSATVWRGTRPIELTSREYQMLLFFLRHPGEVISRDTLLQKVWSNPESGGSNVIDVYVRYLRQKLEAGGESRLLQTVRGQGYVLTETLPPTLPNQP